MLLWALASAAAFSVGGRLGAVMSPSRDIIVIGYLALTASLILAGALQWLVLRQLIADAAWWVPMSFAAAATVGILVFGLGRIDRDVAWVAGVVAGWILLGVLQWLVLHHQVPRAGWWVLANAAGLVVAIPVVGLVSWVSGVPADDSVGTIVRWLAFGAAYGVVTGTALWRLVLERREPAAL